MGKFDAMIIECIIKLLGWTDTSLYWSQDPEFTNFDPGKEDNMKIRLDLHKGTKQVRQKYCIQGFTRLQANLLCRTWDADAPLKLANRRHASTAQIRESHQGKAEDWFGHWSIHLWETITSHWNAVNHFYPPVLISDQPWSSSSFWPSCYVSGKAHSPLKVVPLQHVYEKMPPLKWCWDTMKLRTLLRMINWVRVLSVFSWWPQYRWSSVLGPSDETCRGNCREDLRSMRTWLESRT